MSTIAPAQPMTVPEALARVPSSLYRMTLKQYETMIAAGSFTKRDRIQLINGYLVTRMTELPPHGATCELIRLAIEKFFAIDAWHFRNEKSLRIPGYTSMPLPDLVLVRGTPRAYAHRYPEPSDDALVVEVAISSLAEDRAMAPIYGAGGIPLNWIVNLIDGQVEVHSNPGPTGYATHEVLAPGHVLSVVLDGVEVGEIAVEDALP